MKIRNYLINFFLVFLIILSFNQKLYSQEPDEFIQSIVNEASKALINNNSKEEKMNELKLIALKSVDIKGIGMYSLGSHRKNLNQVQKEKYNEYFF